MTDVFEQGVDAARRPRAGAHNIDEVAAARILMNTKTAAARYGVTKTWLERRRVAGDGPPFIKAPGTVLYDIAQTDAWFRALTIASTSERDALAASPVEKAA